MRNLMPLLGALAATVVAALLAYAGSQGGVGLAGAPLFALCVAAAFLVQWIAFIPAYALQTEKTFDLMGALTYVGLVLLVWATTEPDARSLLLGALIVVWAARLGSFLFLRVRRVGHDARFRHIKPHFPTFFMTWTLQGLWVTFTASCALAAMTSGRSLDLGVFALLGGLCWLAGIVIEVTADQQKSVFRDDPANSDSFITTGLWAWSQHPNYFGEILLWIGVALIAFPALEGWQLGDPRLAGVRLAAAHPHQRHTHA